MNGRAGRPLVGVALLMSLLAGCGSGGTVAGGSTAATGKPVAPPSVSSTEASATPATDDAATVVPDRLVIPRLGVDSTLERLRVGPRGRLRPPADPDLAGWFPDGAVPGDIGAAVIAGHRDSRTGPAVFWKLADLQVGDPLTVTRSDGAVVRFEVAEVRRVSRDRFPTQDVYGATPDRTLRLITCGGVYDHVRGRYLDNVLVLALAV